MIPKPYAWEVLLSRKPFPSESLSLDVWWSVVTPTALIPHGSPSFHGCVHFLSGSYYISCPSPWTGKPLILFPRGFVPASLPLSLGMCFFIRKSPYQRLRLMPCQFGHVIWAHTLMGDVSWCGSTPNSNSPTQRYQWSIFCCV